MLNLVSFIVLTFMFPYMTQGISMGLLCGSGLVVAGSAGEAAVLREHLHAPQWTYEELMHQHVFKKCALILQNINQPS